MDVRPKHRYLVHAIGIDGPGVAGNVCHGLETLDGRVTSFRKTTIDEFFTLIMTVEFSCRQEPSRLCEELRYRGARNNQYAITTYPTQEHDEHTVDGRRSRFVVTVFGEDGPAVLTRLDRCLTARGVLVTDLCGECDGEEFALISHIDVPSDCPFDTLQTDLEGLAEDLECDIKVEDFDVFRACGLSTNRSSPVNNAVKSGIAPHLPLPY